MCLLFNLLLDLTRKLIEEFIKNEAETISRKIQELKE